MDPDALELIHWVESDQGCRAELQYGSVIIAPTVPANPYQPYTARIETRSGKVVATGEYDFENCKVWAAVNLPLLDEVSGNLAECGNVLDTLALCQPLLSTDTDSVHWMRIEHIKAWIAHETKRVYTAIPILLSRRSYEALHWIDQGMTFIADTPHGQAVIEQIRDTHILGQITHKARIRHHTGAELDVYSGPDFMEAEAAIKTQLMALDEPHLNEADLDILHFTLDICKRLLPSDSDPIHYARLDALGLAIHLALD